MRIRAVSLQLPYGASHKNYESNILTQLDFLLVVESP
jgi:hypothetical protein